MKYLMDTCALFALADSSLSTPVKVALENNPNLFVSMVSLWEIAIKQATGKLSMRLKPLDWYEHLLENHQLLELGITREDIATAATLPKIHKDPFDRMIIATAINQNLTILTSDQLISTYPNIQTIW